MATDNEIITVGASLTELSSIFGLDRKDVRIRIGEIKPRTRRGQSDVWRIRDVAPRLIKFSDNEAELVSRILSMHHNDLPKMLSKEYWYGQNQRLKYQREIGELWDTATIVNLASEVFKTLRLSLMLASDSVERETGLTVKQREIVERMIHEALNTTREKLVVRLEHLRKTSDGKAFAPKEIRDAFRVGDGGDAADAARGADDWDAWEPGVPDDEF